MAVQSSIDPRSPTTYSAKSVEITPPQFRAARAMLDWAGATLPLPFPWVAEVERGRRCVSAEVLAIVRFTLEDAGIEYIAEQGEGLGVKLRMTPEDPMATEDLARRLGSSGLELLKQQRCA